MAEKNKKQGAPEVAQTLSQNEAFILKYKNYIIGAIVVLLLCVIGYFYWKNTTTETFQKESTEMAKAQEYFSQAVISDDAGLFTKALNGDSINAGFLAIAAQSGKAANVANLYAGICQARLGNMEEAAKLIEKFDGDDQMVGPAALGALGNIKATLGQIDEAIDMLKKAAAKADNNALSPQFLIQAGQLLESQGKKEEALKLYEQIRDQYQEWTRNNAIENYIERVK